VTDWDIDPAGVGRVLQATYDKSLELETHAGNYGSYLQGAAGNAGGMIADALGGFAISYNPSFNAIAAQVIASMTGAKDATVAYLDGHTEMALNAQRGATGAFDKQNKANQKQIDDDMYNREVDRQKAADSHSILDDVSKTIDTATSGKPAKAEPVEPYTGTGGTSTVDSGRTPDGAA
jgi:Family of unknown function (DUF6507)